MQRVGVDHRHLPGEEGLRRQPERFGPARAVGRGARPGRSAALRKRRTRDLDPGLGEQRLRDRPRCDVDGRVPSGRALERVAEEAGEDAVEAVRAEVVSARERGFAGLKTIVAYRGGLDLAAFPPSNTVLQGRNRRCGARFAPRCHPFGPRTG